MMSQYKKLSIAFYWHFHQPIYQLSPNSDFVMPWVRLHAIKDYFDMVNILDNHPNIKLNFNIVPILLDALIEYSEKDYHDLHSRLTCKATKDLTNDDKEFIINNFFDANYQNMILANNEYHRLFQIYQSSQINDINIFNDQEYSDLMALFNLAWFDPCHKNDYPELKKLIKKEKKYTLTDRKNIIKIQRNIIKKIIPTYKKYLDEGRIEITTSPYYHTILPVLLGDSDNDIKMGDDAKLQCELALDKIEEVFGKRPKGMWPSEHCISPNELKLFKELGLDWTISDEGILSNSINFEFIRDFKGYLEDPLPLTKSYQYEDLKIIFRDSVIPSLISFEYPNHDQIAAANDLYDRIKVAQNKLLSSPDDNHLLTIALDGENSWEKYNNDGNLFLSTIYKLIEEDSSLETVLISDYLKKDTPKPLNKITSGSWINKDFKLWADEVQKDLAWDYLKITHESFIEFKQNNPNHPNIELAHRELLITQGSDWFWWYGEPNDSGRDNIFDYIFREHLKNVYIYLGLAIPEFLDNPISPTTNKPSRYPKNKFTPQINGAEDSEENWLNAGCIKIPDGPVLKEDKFFDKICFGYDKENLYLRFYISEYANQNNFNTNKTHQMFLYTRSQDKKQSLSPIRIVHKKENILPISKEKFHSEIEIAVSNGEISLLRKIKAIPNNLWIIGNNKNIDIVYDKMIDVKIPFNCIDVDTDDTLEFLFINANSGMKDSYIPNEMLLTLKRT
ncbi:MAG: glycoside hydrolase family 57 protein [Candidatus Gastranaerophilales bacterium]